jgi:3-deoxy-D-manno-octulosonic-acid transferase
MTLDLRIMRILSRLENSQEVLKKISSYLKQLANVPRSSRIILGSAYPVEMKIFENKKLVEDLESGKIHLCIAPHKLDQTSVASILSLIPKNLQPVSVSSFSPVSLMLVPGILCELYANFGHAYVGGGHLKSIHSVLEPYLGGAKVYCGPKTHRSTEFDFVMGHSNITVVTNPKDFYDYVVEGSDVLGPPDQKGFKDDLGKLISFLEMEKT